MAKQDLKQSMLVLALVGLVAVIIWGVPSNEPPRSNAPANSDNAFERFANLHEPIAQASRRDSGMTVIVVDGARYAVPNNEVDGFKLHMLGPVAVASYNVDEHNLSSLFSSDSLPNLFPGCVQFDDPMLPKSFVIDGESKQIDVESPGYQPNISWYDSRPAKDKSGHWRPADMPWAPESPSQVRSMSLALPALMD